MEYYFRLIIAAIIVFFSIQIFPQVKFASDSIDYQYAGKGLNDRIVYISFRDGTELKCKLVGYKEDTIVVLTKWIQKVPLSFIYKIKIEDRNYEGWAQAGFYAGQVIFFSGFGMEKDAPVYRVGLDLAIIVRGGLSLATGLLVWGFGSGINGNEVFSFEGTNDEIKAESIRLEEFILGERINKKRFQISFTASVVNTTYSKVVDQLKSNMDGPGTLYSSINMVRKIQATYSLNSKLDIGAAYVLTGEPPFTWYKFLSIDQNDGGGSFSYSGHGIYSIAQYNLINTICGRPFDLVAGGGLGFAKITYSNSTYLQNNRSYVSKEKVLLSGYLYSSLRLRLNEYTLIGLTADYVIIPETKVGIEYLNVKPESFSNFSYGLSFMFEL